ncbi:cyclic di-GMP phosphodiesterase response regulator RpfG [Desulfosporosinus acididurans]|uniref:Cyclic di-GMP phosphodiesterase response regulator RpfG n=1 Tax=Desulfosporosinus acididurans TaxID=476652 RepID=A0A0J1FTZ8_9FIRM|nr:HD-GYP domain-containing protein [Desulfosporosinus acididurans]KLU66934.1 cyclic di-GMP phosphodiesterase response regulator RpfG [Desulfosporosinus acididurans]
MHSLSKRFKGLFILVTILAVLILIISAKNSVWNNNQFIDILIFSILAIASESLPVALPRGGFVTVSYSVFFTAVILFPSCGALIVAAVGGLFPLGNASKDTPLFKRVFNGSQYLLSQAAAVCVLKLTGIESFHTKISSLVGYILVAFAYMITNISIVTLALGFLQRKSPWSIWISNMRWALPNFMALVPVGYLMALIFYNYGALGLFLLFIPLLVCRHSFQLYMDMRENYLNTVEALVQALEAKDKYTSGHSARVGKLAVVIAEEIEMNEDKTEFLKYAAVLHDVGKIGVSEIILNKEGKLLDSEWESIRSHPVIGETIIKSIKFMFDIGQVVRHHHERYDGKGYPDGIQGEDIPLESRIIAVADTYDAITSDRSYRKGKTHEEAIEELKRVAGSQLDPKLVEVFCRVVTLESVSRIINAGKIQIASSC